MWRKILNNECDVSAALVHFFEVRFFYIVPIWFLCKITIGNKLNGQFIALCVIYIFAATGEAERIREYEEEKKLVDIGFPAARLSRQEETKLRIEYQKQVKHNPEIEKLARHLKRKSSKTAKHKINSWMNEKLF